MLERGERKHVLGGRRGRKGQERVRKKRGEILNEEEGKNRKRKGWRA
jgi:hypothetical protein